MSKVIAIANQKGGVGKTTTTRELSACCALRGYRVLTIDCDPQMQPDYLTHQLRNQLKEHGADYDLIFIDCPPQLGKLLTARFTPPITSSSPAPRTRWGGLSDLPR